MRRPMLSLSAAALAAILAPAAASAGGGCGCGQGVVPGATVDLEFAGCPCGCGPTCGAPAAAYGTPGCAAPDYAAGLYAAPACAAPAYAAPVYAAQPYGGCDNRDFTRRPGCGLGNGLTGGLRKLWDLEKRKNAWLKKTFIDGPRKGCCLKDDCAPVYAAPACGECRTCEPACAAPAYAEPACAAPAYGTYAEPACAAPVYAAPTCGCND